MLAKTVLLFCESLHGAEVTPGNNIAQRPDLLVGVVPAINLEWIQKPYRDKKPCGDSTEAVTEKFCGACPTT